jgi:monoamine oxidase
VKKINHVVRDIHFAGDATEWNFAGYMEGAVLSGERCAAEI